MLRIRVWHTYLGILIAPSVIFFALTGALQIFNLHEEHGAYTPPVLIEKLSRLHKDQVFERKEKEDQPEPPKGNDAQSGPQTPPPEPPTPIATVLLKWFFLLVALGLATSTSLGLWMGLTHVQRKRTGWWLLAAGIVVPVLLAVL